MGVETGMERQPELWDIQALSFAEQLVVWSLRSWTQGVNGAPSQHSVLRDTYERVGSRAAYLAFDHLASVIAVSARRPILIHCPHCRGASQDEMLFLGLIADVQQDEVTAAYMNLADWLAPAGARAAMPGLTAYAMHMTGAGLTLRSWDEIRRCPVLTPAPSPDRPPSALLH